VVNLSFNWLILAKWKTVKVRHLYNVKNENARFLRVLCIQDRSMRD